MRVRFLVLPSLAVAALMMSPSASQAQRVIYCWNRGYECGRNDDAWDRAERARSQAIDRADRIREQVRRGVEQRFEMREVMERRDWDRQFAARERAERTRELARERYERERELARDRAERSREFARERADRARELARDRAEMLRSRGRYMRW